jgi:hypothetical protein
MKPAQVPFFSKKKKEVAFSPSYYFFSEQKYDYKKNKYYTA